MRRSRHWTALTAVAALGSGLAAGIAQAQPTRSWGVPSREFARYGVRTMICDTRTHDAPCLGLACRAGTPALVQRRRRRQARWTGRRGACRPGRAASTLRFRFDERAIDQLSVAAASAELTRRSARDTPLAATSITLTAQSDARIRHQSPDRRPCRSGAPGRRRLHAGERSWRAAPDLNAGTPDAGASLLGRAGANTRVDFMKRILTWAVVALAVALAGTPAEAKGCMKGAVVGGGASSAGRRGPGAAAGCLIGRHRRRRRPGR